MNKANKITMSRIIMAVIIMILLLFPFYEMGYTFPTYLVKDNILIDLRYIIAGVIFIIASITDFFDGRVARKYNFVTDLGKVIDTISDKVLTNSLLIILACQGMVAPIIAVVIVVRDIVTDSLKMIIGNKSSAVGAIYIAKVKTATLMFGLVFTLFYNLPFELYNLRVAEFLLVIAAVLSVISGVKYYLMAKPYFKDK